MSDSLEVLVLGSGWAAGMAVARLAESGRSVLWVEEETADLAGDPGVTVRWEREPPSSARPTPVGERLLIDHEFEFFDGPAVVTFGCRDPNWASSAAARINGRSSASAFLRARAFEAGAERRVVTTPPELTSSPSGGIMGLRVGTGSWTAPITVIADPRRVPLGGRMGRTQSTFLVDEFDLSDDDIERRFGVRTGETVLSEFVGEPELGRGVVSGFLLPFSGGLAVGVASGAANDPSFDGLARGLDAVEAHPHFSNLLRGRSRRSRSQRFTFAESSGGRVAGPGWISIGAATGLLYSNGFRPEGVDFGIRSTALVLGMIGGTHGLVPGVDLNRRYRAALQVSGVLEEVQRGRALGNWISKNSRRLGTYANFFHRSLRRLMTETGRPKERVVSALRAERRVGGPSILQLLRDGAEVGMRL